MSPTNSKSTTSAEEARLKAAEVLDGLSDEVKGIMQDVLKLELGYLSHRSPNSSKLAREIAEIVRRRVD